MSPDTPTLEILVVCYGNLCRSPMAAALLAQRLPEARILSAGTNAIGGDPARPHAIEAIRHVAGLDIAGHRSRPLTVDLLERADHVLTMSTRQAHLAVALAPAARDRVRLLGAYAQEDAQSRSADPGRGAAGPAEIADPIGGSLEEFEQCLERLGRAVDRFASWLEEGAEPDHGPPAVGSERWPFRVDG